jgi:hypothetical protein
MPETSKTRTTVDDIDQRIVDGCIVALAGWTNEELRDVAEAAERRSDGKSWLAHMIRDYLETWRQ